MFQDFRILRGVLQGDGGKGRARRGRLRRQRDRSLPFLLVWTFGQKMIFTSTAVASIPLSRPAVEAIFLPPAFRGFGLLSFATFGLRAGRRPGYRCLFALLVIGNPCLIRQILRSRFRRLFCHRENIFPGHRVGLIEQLPRVLRNSCEINRPTEARHQQDPIIRFKACRLNALEANKKEFL